jgi:hypothetical protein
VGRKVEISATVDQERPNLLARTPGRFLKIETVVRKGETSGAFMIKILPSDNP